MSMNPQDGSRPTVVLVHGAFAEFASWNDVIGRLQEQGYTGKTLESVPLADGTTDLYIRQEEYHQQFAADAPAEQAALDAVTQRMLRDVALSEGSGTPAWKAFPSWFVFPDLDKNIPLEAHRFMAERAEAREVVEIEGASPALAASHPDEVADVILRALEDVE
jgi:pimeloyl-ACP methyl ester carboxylesterase